mmetsp:Transcript_68840/g.128480  ORF Transcript_68840/g.128480 Transcript_68840/m.128480 type:complete len:390 (+) Transcript_68840:47-1216(+)
MVLRTFSIAVAVFAALQLKAAGEPSHHSGDSNADVRTGRALASWSTLSSDCSLNAFEFLMFFTATVDSHKPTFNKTVKTLIARELNTTVECTKLEFVTSKDSSRRLAGTQVVGIVAVDRDLSFTDVDYALVKDSFTAKLCHALGSDYSTCVSYVTTQPVPTTSTTTTTTTKTKHVAAVVTTTRMASTTTTTLKCAGNAFDFDLFLSGIDASSNGFTHTMAADIAAMLNTTSNCVFVESAAPSNGRLRRLAATEVKGEAFVPDGMTREEIKAALSKKEFRDLVCGVLAAQGSTCSVDSVEAILRSTSTTTEMPWGWPWWAWFALCCGSACFCVVLCMPLAAVCGSSSRKKSTSSRMSENIDYEVVEVPEDEVHLVAGEGSAAAMRVASSS